MALRAALGGPVRGKLGVRNTNLDASLNNGCGALTLKSARLPSFPTRCNLLSPLVKRHTTGTACIGAGVERGGPVRAALPREKLILGPSLPAPSLSSARGRLPKHPGGPASLWRKGMMEPYLVPRLPPSFLWDLHRRQSARRSGVKVMHRHLHGCCVQRGSASLSPRDPLRLHVCRCQSYRRK